jgi:hypothetical protein
LILTTVSNSKSLIDYMLGMRYGKEGAMTNLRQTDAGFSL